MHWIDKYEHLLAVPTVFTVIGSRGFSYAAPSTANEIPVEIRNSSSLPSIKKHILRHIINLVPSFSAITPSLPQ